MGGTSTEPTDLMFEDIPIDRVVDEEAPHHYHDGTDAVVVGAEGIVNDANGDWVKPPHRNYRKPILLALLVGIVALAVGLGYGLSNKNNTSTVASQAPDKKGEVSDNDPSKDGSGGNNPAPAPAPSPNTPGTAVTAPTGTPVAATAAASVPTLVDNVKDFLIAHGVSNATALSDSASPQSRAATWIAVNDTFVNGTLPDDDTNVLASDFVVRYILATLYYSTAGPLWLSPFHWLDDEHHCNWNVLVQDGAQSYRGGAVCDDDGVLRSVSLGLNLLQGPIPTELGILSSLKRLDLHRNDMYGRLPTELCNLHQLELLLLWSNAFTSTIPDCIGHSMSGLQTLALANNHLHGPLPTNFANMSSLVNVIMDDNALTGDITHAFDNMLNLTYVFLDRNNFTATLDNDFLVNNDRLIRVDLSENRLRGTIGANLFTMPAMNLLDLHDNQLTGSIPEVAASNQVLQYVALHQNQLGGPIPETISNLPNLVHLDLSENSLTGTITSEIGSLVNVTYLFLANNNFTAGPIPAGLANMPSLSELSLKSTQRTGALPTFLGTLSQLVILDVEGNRLTGNIPSGLGNVSSLEFLLLNENEGINGELPLSFVQMTNLRAAFFEKTSLSGSLNLLCALGMFNETAGDPDGTELLIADCNGSSPEVSCTCCTTCCSDDVDTCHNHHDVASVDPDWEVLFDRQNIRLSDSASFVDGDLILP